MDRRFFIFVCAVLIAIWGCGLVDAYGQGDQSGSAAASGKGNALVIPEVARDEVICFALYTVQDEIMKMTAVLYPLGEGESREVRLEVEESSGEWKEIATAAVNEEGWTALFRLEDWDHGRDWPYRVRHGEAAIYEGLIRRDPVDKDEIVVAAFTGNSNKDRGPREDIIANIKAQDPDLLFFSGDQSYDHTKHTAAWLLFGRQFGEIIKDRPTVSIPDDHDVGQGNLWGQGGIVSTLKGGADGGYVMPPEYVNMVQRAQTGNLPDPYDPTPVAQGITVFYTSLNVGGIDFAIIEDRKFKTGPAGLIPRQGPRPDHINDPDYDRATVDVPEAILLGERQLAFLRAWGQDWEGSDMKCVLSQTIFAGGAHLHGKLGGRLLADLDSNGWPQSGRARAWEEMRRCFSFHLAGDQHLATVIHHGLNSWEDSGYSFCVPSIVNYYGRWWWPLEEPQAGGAAATLEFAGRYYDGLGNKVTMQAYANPTEDNFKAAGHGLVRFNKRTREITMECWPRFVDVADVEAKQFEGWPITISQADNYNREAIAHLPELVFEGAERPVVQVVKDDTGEVVYTVRAWGERYRPKVFQEGNYTVLLDGRVVHEGVAADPVEVATD
ncbi:MAG: hypothetical protein AAGD22_08145 [Verrucomicrobiota bacterium]